MTTDHDSRWTEFCTAQAEAHRLQAQQFEAEIKAARLHPYIEPNPKRIAHLEEMRDSYLTMAANLTAQITTTAQEGTQA